MPKPAIKILNVDLYDKLIESASGIERKGKTMPYTSVNGHMFSFLDKNGEMGLRLPQPVRDEFIKKYNTKLSVQHDKVMKEYVVVPYELLSNTEKLKEYLKISHDYILSLKPKATKKIKKIRT